MKLKNHHYTEQEQLSEFDLWITPSLGDMKSTDSCSAIMRTSLLLIILGLMGLVSGSSAKESYRYRSITIDDGLTSNAVRNIVQDADGYLWFGTDNGLCRYDGIGVQPYRIAENGPNQYVSALLAHDSHIYVGTEQGVFRLDPITPRFERLPLAISTTVTHLATDKEGQLWVSTNGQGVWCYSLKTGQQQHYSLPQVNETVAQVFIDANNQVWSVSNMAPQSVSKLNRLQGRFEPVSLNSSTYYNSLSMLQTRNGQLWLGSWEQGLLLMHSDGHLEQVLNPATQKMGSHIHTLFERSDDCICIGCDDGIICFNPHTRACSRLLPLQSLSDRFVYSIVSDAEGGLWAGTFYGGVVYVSPVDKRFSSFTADDGLAGNVVSRFCEDRQGRVWIASDDGGLMCFLPQTHTFASYAHQAELGHQNAHALALKGSQLWIGTYTNGVFVLNTDNGQLRHYTHSASTNSLDDNSSYAILHDSKGRTWVATMQGLNLYNPVTDDFSRVATTGALIIDIDEDHSGHLWLSTQGGGLWKLNTQTRQLQQYANSKANAHSLPNDQVNCAHVDATGRLWIGTPAGLCYYDAAKNHFVRATSTEHLGNIMGIVEDQDVLWLSTDQGVVRHESMQQERAGQRFTRHDGLVSQQFQPNACLKASDGLIYLGTTSGFSTFYPYQIKANTVMPPVYITSLNILNSSKPTAAGDLPIDLSKTKELTLDYDDARMLTLSFASLSYCSPEKNQYAYKLEGFDRDWNYVGSQHRATYTNIPAGTYTFCVRATNNDGIWSPHEATLRIVVHPPFWWSWWAKLLYLLLLAAAIWFYVRFRLKRAEESHQQELQRIQEQKEKEVREARLNFFTMIAHEIRTPVSLIIGPLEKIKIKSDELRIIDRNAHRLLELVNQLLDFRKVEQQSLVMHFASQDINEIIRSVSERFRPTFEQGGKHFKVVEPDSHFTAIVDREGVTKVISNLLTNANKYTKSRVELRCVTEPDETHFRIEVADDGVGIRPEDRQRIFAPFFQAQDNKPGTGIGLNIVKNIVEQHHGTISVESEVGQGSTFTVVLPVVQDLTAQQPTTAEAPLPIAAENDEPENAATTPNAAEESTDSQQQGTLLIVDDSDDMVAFLQAHFSRTYHVLTASDGIEALDLLAHHEVSIIISDWMMPRMDGAQLCQHVRQNAHTSHIPFVMLTAKTDDGSKTEGMNAGADVYIEKPFSVEYVTACIQNILQMRHRLMQKFSSQPWENMAQMASNPTDNEFLTKMNALIEENVANSALSVNFLAEQLNISRSGLFAKLKSLADVTPNEMIQVVRLKRAAQLLLEGKYLVSEVGYMVGFSSPSYFTKCFYKQFGKKPTEFAKQQPSTNT